MGELVEADDEEEEVKTSGAEEERCVRACRCCSWR